MTAFMKKVLKIMLIVLGIIIFANYVFAQNEPILGSWTFALDKKYSKNAVTDTLVARGIPQDSIRLHAMFFSSFAAIIVARCDYSEIFFSPFENQVMLTTYRINDPTLYDRDWGRWVKITDGRYMVEFKKRLEFYVLNEQTGEFHYQKPPNDHGFVGAMLDDNLKLIKKGD